MEIVDNFRACPKEGRPALFFFFFHLVCQAKLDAAQSYWNPAEPGLEGCGFTSAISQLQRSCFFQALP